MARRRDGGHDEPGASRPTRALLSPMTTPNDPSSPSPDPLASPGADEDGDLLPPDPTAATAASDDEPTDQPSRAPSDEPTAGPAAEPTAEDHDGEDHDGEDDENAEPAAEPTADDGDGEDDDDDGPPSIEPNGFDGLGLRDELLDTLVALGYEEPTPIQREAIPTLLTGSDLLGQAATGTGKTAAFALPLLHRLPDGGKPVPSALVLVPTRELAVQVSEAIYRYGKDLGAKVLPIYGGQDIRRQLDALRRGVHVVVATPGRAKDHVERGSLSLGTIRTVVLDEADEMLDMGFAEDIEAILDATPSERQTVLFSATMPGRIDAIARRHLRDPVRIRIHAEKAAEGEAPQVRQSAYVVARAHKPAALGRILDVETPTAAIVFCRTRIEVDQLTETLNGRGYRAEALHGGMSQEQRDRVMGRMRAGTAELLVATDVAARGLDLDQLTHVVNYDVPSAPEAYVHRIGRVGRAGREGVAITLAEPRERRLLGNIERLTKQKVEIEKVPSVADLQARRLEQTADALREALAGDDLEQFRPLVESLTDEWDLTELTLAAVKLVHEASGAGNEDLVDIPDVAAKPERPKRDGPKDKGWERGSSGDRSRDGGRPSGPVKKY
jgi:ATP-dependent RNA helicase DeaD